ncbi:MAG: type II secretion system protein GspL [Myxococcota bacterium]|nr:type II secretion system protein GspL [Myxococcota bacterium]
MARQILSLDVGSHAIKAAVFNQAFRGVELEQLRVLTRREIEAREDDDLSAALRDWVQTHALEGETVITSLPGDRVSTRLLHFPFRDRRRIAPAVPFEVESQVPFDLDRFVLDWQLLASEKAGAEVGVTLAPEELVREHFACLQGAGLPPRILEAEGLSLAHLARLFELEGPRLLLDVGHRKTTLCLCLDGQPVTARCIPVGGQALTEAIAHERGVSLEEAEAIKHRDGIFGGDGRTESPGAIQAVERLGREILRSLGSAGEAFGSDSALRILLLGGSAHLHRIDEFLSQQTRIPSERLALPQGELSTAVTSAGDPLLFGPALALAARATGPSSSGVNLLQDDLAPRLDFQKVGREWGLTAALAGLALAIGVCGVVVDGVIEGNRAKAVETKSQALYAEAFPGRPAPRSLVSGMQKALEDAERRADTLGVYRGNLSALDILQEVSSHVPKELDVVFEELVIDRRMVQVKGHSPSFGDVDKLRVALSRFEPFSEITVGDITNDARRGGRNFSVRISLAAGGGDS